MPPPPCSDSRRMYFAVLILFFLHISRTCLFRISGDASSPLYIRLSNIPHGFISFTVVSFSIYTFLEREFEPFLPSSLKSGIYFVHQTTLVGIQILSFSFQVTVKGLSFFSVVYYAHTLVSTNRSGHLKGISEDYGEQDDMEECPNATDITMYYRSRVNDL